ncbi:VOC family protein [Shouchella rhizosphaerae]|nr:MULTISPECIES: VOC family protein [Shouchella]
MEKAEEARDFYVSVFANSQLGKIERYRYGQLVSHVYRLMKRSLC